ncbi:hypothetical protein TWF225_007272 [Orbilia oligospora]|nr:hypothetical protein TWF225_007272 [Orbilia oligospora]KAF3239649.1 hypothetical protein TWF128_011749 [Orbilia oligospora]KAF3255392.1 hypothetical protein TWF217_006567 [Orbilia oligospora]KAF3295698.1 hypothetical protein TWF132_001024 [Orbilia oligospora]
MCWSILGGWRCYSDIPEQAMSRHSHESTYFSRTRILDEDNNTEKIPHPLISLRVSKHILAAGLYRIRILGVNETSLYIF